MATSQSFRVGKVTAYLRGSVWYLRYHENGKRHQVRASDDKKAARQLASQVNAQLETGAPAATSFQPITIVELRSLWLDHHEHVLRSSVATINRYRTATDHLINFVAQQSPNKQASRFGVHDAEALVRYLRKLEVAPNGHANATKRRLRDKGVKYILEVCRSLFNFAIKRRHMPPYTENPFSVIEIDRIPVEDAKPFTDLSPEKEREFLEACDDWQFPIFATLLLTGLRPGELTHLLLPHDVNLEERYIQVRNKPKLGWQVKTRNERRVPLMPELSELLKIHIGDRKTGPLFLRRRFIGMSIPVLGGRSEAELEAELLARIESQEKQADSTTRAKKSKLAYQVWRDAGAIRTERVRLGYMQVTKKIGLPSLTAPKLLRHLFATALQDGNVDPLIRMQLMGHTANNGDRTGTPLSMTGHYTQPIGPQPFDLVFDRSAQHLVKPAVQRPVRHVQRISHLHDLQLLPAVLGNVLHRFFHQRVLAEEHIRRVALDHSVWRDMPAKRVHRFALHQFIEHRRGLVAHLEPVVLDGGHGRRDRGGDRAVIPHNDPHVPGDRQAQVITPLGHILRDRAIAVHTLH